MSKRIREHLRTNLVGYVALFLVLTGGTAYALDGSNTVFSDDIVNGEVRTADIRNGTITSTDVAAGGLTGANLADRTIGGQKVGIETLTGANVSDGSLFGADIANGSLTSQDLGTHSVGAAQLDPAAFLPADIAPVSPTDPRLQIPDNAIQSSEVSDNSLTGADINEATLDTPEAAFDKSDASVSIPETPSETTLASRTVEPGAYVILAKASLLSSDGDFANCRLHASRPGFESDIDQAEVATVKKDFGLPGGWGEMSLMGLFSSTSGNIQLAMICHSSGNTLTASNVRLVALKMNRLVGTDAP